MNHLLTPPATFAADAGGFGWLDYGAMGVYLASMIVVGLYFAGREKTTDDFFLAGKRIPWWAAGLSIFATQLSAITYLAIPARSYDSDWSTFLVNMGILAVAPLIVFVVLPFYRKLNVTTAYEYLEKRFDVSVRLFGSASFIAYQLGRMGVVTLLPSLALSAVTGIDVFVAIALMGVLSTAYTVLGGIEAVIWTDVVQVIVLAGGAIAALAIMAAGVDGGLGQLVGDGLRQGKFNLANLNWDWTGDALAVIALNAVFHNLTVYSSDQAVVQRYLTTRTQRQAAKAIWINAALSLVASLLFFFVGTALWVFYKEHPAQLGDLSQKDQIFPWFIAHQMPVGLAGLVIAGVFAASMSSLDSSMHSISTAVTTDFVRRFKRKGDQSDQGYLRFARVLTIALGLGGTASAMLMATIEIKYLWDFFLGIVGLFLSTLGGVFMLGMFVPRAGAAAAWCGAVAAIAALLAVNVCTDLDGKLYAAIGVATCVGVGAIMSFVLPRPDKDVRGLTVQSMSAPSQHD